jgi:hypothetical protein
VPVVTPPHGGSHAAPPTIFILNFFLKKKLASIPVKIRHLLYQNIPTTK